MLSKKLSPMWTHRGQWVQLWLYVLTWAQCHLLGLYLYTSWWCVCRLQWRINVILHPHVTLLRRMIFLRATQKDSYIIHLGKILLVLDRGNFVRKKTVSLRKMLQSFLLLPPSTPCQSLHIVSVNFGLSQKVKKKKSNTVVKKQHIRNQILLSVERSRLKCFRG